MITRYGFIKPDGTWIAVPRAGDHLLIARDHFPGIQGRGDLSQALHAAGWIRVTKCTPDGPIIATHPLLRARTQRQLDTLFDYAQRWGLDFLEFANLDNAHVHAHARASAAYAS